jgi:hypothetical protein
MINMSNSQIIIKFLTLLLLLVISTFIGWKLGEKLFFFTDKPIEKPIYIEATPHFLAFMTDDVTYKENMISTQVIASGILGYISGDYDALIIADKAITKSRKIQIKNKDKKTKTETLRAATSNFYLEQTDKEKLLRIFISTKQTSGDLRLLFSDLCNKEHKPINHPMLIDKDNSYCPLLDIKSNQLVFLKFIDTPIDTTFLRSIPLDLKIGTKKAWNFGSPKDHELKQAKTVIVSIISDKEEQKNSRNSKIILLQPSVRMETYNGTLKFADKSFMGHLDINIPNMEYTLPIYLSRDNKRDFDAAFTLYKSKNASSWFSFIGGSQYIELEGQSNHISIGKEHYTITPQDSLELFGKFVFTTEFTSTTAPSINIRGRAESCKINGIQILESPWTSIHPSIRGGIIGAFIGAFTAFLLSLFTITMKQKISSKQK